MTFEFRQEIRARLDRIDNLLSTLLSKLDEEDVEELNEELNNGKSRIKETD